MATSNHEVFVLRNPLLSRCARRWIHWGQQEACPQATHCCRWVGLYLGQPRTYRSFVCPACAELFSIRWNVPIKAVGAP